MNQTILIGRVGKDADFKPDVGDGLARFSVATSERFKDKAGEWKDSTTWHNVVAWGGVARAAKALATKGALVIVVGETKSRSYEKDGEKRTAVEVNARQVLGGTLPPKQAAEKAVRDADAAQAKAPASTIDDDEIPF